MEDSEVKAKDQSSQECDQEDSYEDSYSSSSSSGALFEDPNLKNLKPKIKLRELKAIQKGQKSFNHTLDRMQTYKDAPPTSKTGGAPMILDREMKKVIELERLFQKRELEIKRKQQFKDRREMKLKLLENPPELTPNVSLTTAESQTSPPPIIRNPPKEYKIPKKRGRKPGSLNKKTIQRLLGKKRGRKPKNLKEQIIRQQELMKSRSMNEASNMQPKISGKKVLGKSATTPSSDSPKDKQDSSLIMQNKQR